MIERVIKIQFKYTVCNLPADIILFTQNVYFF